MSVHYLCLIYISYVQFILVVFGLLSGSINIIILMLMRVRNGLFKVVSRMIEASSRVKYGVMAGTEEGN